MKRYVERYFMGLNWSLVVASLLLSFIWAKYYDGDEAIKQFLELHHRTVYGVLASIYGSLLGFTITTVSIILGFSGSERLKLLRQSVHYSTLWQIFKHAIRWLGLATVSSILLIAPNGNTTIIYVGSFFSFGVLLHVIILLGRCIWVLEEIITLVTSGPNQQ